MPRGACASRRLGDEGSDAGQTASELLSNYFDVSPQGNHCTAKPFVKLKRLAVQKFGFWSRYQPW